MYTVEDLRNTFIKKHQEKLNDRHYRDEIQPLFKEDGSFNRGNWSSFQDDIRSRLESSEIVCCDNELHIECRKPDENNEDCTIIINLDAFIVFSCDQWHVIISIICDETEDYDSYIVSWYKSRGRTDMITKNGKPINIDEYVEALNKLEDLGFFDAKLWKF